MWFPTSIASVMVLYIGCWKTEKQLVLEFMQAGRFQYIWVLKQGSKKYKKSYLCDYGVLRGGGSVFVFLPEQSRSFIIATWKALCRLWWKLPVLCSQKFHRRFFWLDVGDVNPESEDSNSKWNFKNVLSMIPTILVLSSGNLQLSAHSLCLLILNVTLYSSFNDKALQFL